MPRFRFFALAVVAGVGLAVQVSLSAMTVRVGFDKAFAPRRCAPGPGIPRVLATSSWGEHQTTNQRR